VNAPEFKAWLKHHQIACERGDWPTDGVFYAAWKRRLDKIGCDLATACRASDRVAESPPSFVDKHLDAVCDAVIGIYRERDAAGERVDLLTTKAERGEELNPGEVAELQKVARGCPSCSGTGLAVRFSVRNPGRSATLHCRCLLGRWIRERHRKTSPDVYRRTPDLADHPWLDAPEYGGPDEGEGGYEGPFSGPSSRSGSTGGPAF
jgi:hypothetical protein